MTSFDKLRKNWLDFEAFKKEFQKVPVKEYPNNVLAAVPKPMVSIHVITYQHVDYIHKTLDTVLSQKIEVPYEIIIGDDDSTDGTREICIEYAKKHPDIIRLFLHKRENNIKVLGSPTGIFQIAYNTFQCRGTYFGICSGDDYWQDDLKIQKQVQFLEKSKSVSFTYHDHTRLFPDKDEIKGPYAVDRIQTVVGRNIFDKLPREFLNIMQEDSFFKFFWRQTGKTVYMSDIKPAVVRFHPQSMYTSIAKEEEFKQRVNLWQNIILASRDSKKIEREARYKLIEVVFYVYRNRKDVNLLKKIKYILRDISKLNMYSAGLSYLPVIGLKKCKRVFIRIWR